MCRAELRRRRDAPVAIRASLVFALVFAGSGEEAMVAADGLIEAAEATGNPFVLSFVLAACGTAFGDTDPAHAMDALGRGLVIAQDSGFRAESAQRNGVPRDQYRDHSPARHSRRPNLRIARPQGRDDDYRRHGDLRIRPNRPGPSRTERCLEIDDIRGLKS